MSFENVTQFKKRFLIFFFLPKIWLFLICDAINWAHLSAHQSKVIEDNWKSAHLIHKSNQMLLVSDHPKSQPLISTCLPHKRNNSSNYRPEKLNQPRTLHITTSLLLRQFKSENKGYGYANWVNKILRIRNWMRKLWLSSSQI